MQAPLQSPRSAHAVCCCQAGSISASRLRTTGKGRMCRYPKGTQATAMLCIHAQYRTRRSAQRVPQMTLETNIQRFTGGEGPPDTRCVKLKVALSGITDSFWVVTDNYAGYGAHPSLTRDHEATRPHLPRSPGTARAALPMRCSEGSDKFLLPFHGVSTKWLQHLSRLLPVDKAGEACCTGQQGDALRPACGRQLCTRETRLSTGPSPSGTGGRQGPRSIVVLPRVLHICGCLRAMAANVVGRTR
jgi:hypothetical protein